MMNNMELNPNDVLTSSVTEEEAERREEARAALMHGWYKECCQYYAENYQRAPAPVIRKDIAIIIRDGMTGECLKAIMDESQNAARPSWAYCKAIVNRCLAYDIKTIGAWNEDRARREAARNPALAYQPREYSDEDFGPEFFSRKPAQPRTREWKNPALDYAQREYKDEDFGSDFYFDYDKVFGSEKVCEKGPNPVPPRKEILREGVPGNEAGES